MLLTLRPMNTERTYDALKGCNNPAEEAKIREKFSRYLASKYLHGKHSAETKQNIMDEAWKAYAGGLGAVAKEYRRLALIAGIKQNNRDRKAFGFPVKRMDASTAQALFPTHLKAVEMSSERHGPYWSRTLTEAEQATYIQNARAKGDHFIQVDCSMDCPCMPLRYPDWF